MPDIYRLVEEVEKQKKAASVEDIFSLLDNVSNDTTPIEELRRSMHSSATVTLKDFATTSTGRAIKPSLPAKVDGYDTRFECFKMLIGGVDYGEGNSELYVKGHRYALEKYYEDAANNAGDLYLTESRLNEELVRFGSYNDLTRKGYFDGLNYVLKALKKSKELMAARIASLLKKEL